MTDALNRAHRCRDLAEEYRRLAAIDSSTDIRDRYLRGWESITASWLRPRSRADKRV
jgi:hypothetical protein